MSLRCAFVIENVNVDVTVIRSQTQSAIAWAAASHEQLQKACVIAGLCFSPFSSLPGVSLREVSVNLCAGKGSVKVTLEGGKERSTSSKCWRVASSSDFQAALGQMRAWGLTRQVLMSQLELPWTTA